MVLSMDRWVDKVAIVTGASSGIGAAIAEQLVEEGVKVAGLARRQDRLDELAKKLASKKGEFFPIKTDMTKEEDILNAFKWIKENLGPVHILVNNAGYGLSIATREAVQDMKANNVEGHIFHINSLSGHSVVPNFPLNVYSASKFAVRALAETLRLELNSLKLRIKITNLSPGLVDTELPPAELQNKRQELYEAAKMIEADNIADGVIYALSTPPHVQIQQLSISAVKNFLT